MMHLSKLEDVSMVSKYLKNMQALDDKNIKGNGIQLSSWDIPACAIPHLRQAINLTICDLKEQLGRLGVDVDA